MNRAKVWVFTLLVVAFGFLLVRTATVSRRADAVAALDARLASAAAHVAASARSLMNEASAVAGVVARDPRLRAALAEHEPPAPPPAPRGRKGALPPPPDRDAEEAKLQEAARQALSAAERELGFELPAATVVSAGNREWLARKGEPGPAEGEALGLLRAAIGGQPRRGFVRLSEGLWYGAAAPAGDGAAASILVPLDAAWLRQLSTGAGADVTVLAPDAKPVSTARPADVPQLQQATKVAGAGDVGAPGKVAVSLGPVALPALPQPVAGGAPLRARAIPIEGVQNAFAVVSIPAAASVQAPAAFFWRAVAGLAAVLVAGLVLGFLVSSSGDRPPQVPEELHAAAVRIEKGDFAARAPPLAGRLGTVAAALNRAAELAGPAQAARGAPPAPATTGEWYQGVPSDAAPAQPGAQAPLPAPPAAPAAPPAPAFEVDEETHWQQVFQDFLRTRASCGEPSEGLTYDKFRQKLEGNKAQLVAKYGCKSVRFQVYVKDGKAALKATPVK
jgi:hypothetical protein